jgi:hypothetical protein
MNIQSPRRGEYARTSDLPLINPKAFHRKNDTGLEPAGVEFIDEVAGRSEGLPD